MGPFRRGIALSFVPTAVFAEVCDKERPFWDPHTGPASAWDELLGLTILPIPLLLFGITFVALVLHRRILFALCAILWLATATTVYLNRFTKDLTGVAEFAIKEGCIGPPHLFIALAIAICALMIYGAQRPRN